MKMKNVKIDIDLSFIALVILVILCVGEPDLLDAIIKRVGGY
jgi:hypothetical protein